MMTKQAPHQHDYQTIKYVPIMVDNLKYLIGTNGVKALLTRNCDCGEAQAFEMGDRRDMKVLYNELLVQQQLQESL